MCRGFVPPREDAPAGSSCRDSRAVPCRRAKPSVRGKDRGRLPCEDRRPPSFGWEGKTLVEAGAIFQRGPVLDHQGRTVKRDELAALEFSEGPRHGFPGGADDLTDFFVLQREPDASSAFRFQTLLRPVEQEAGQLLRRGVCEAERPDLLARPVVVRA